MQELSSVDDILVKINGPRVVIFFYMNNCGPCQLAKPVFEEYVKRYPSISFFRVNTDEVEDALEEFSIYGVPKFEFYSNSTLRYQVSGFNPPKIDAAIQNLSKLQ
jgi:thiol-disulfide isomerase/thioredoxin